MYVSSFFSIQSKLVLIGIQLPTFVCMPDLLVFINSFGIFVWKENNFIHSWNIHNLFYFSTLSFSCSLCYTCITTRVIFLVLQSNHIRSLTTLSVSSLDVKLSLSAFVWMSLFYFFRFWFLVLNHLNGFY